MVVAVVVEPSLAGLVIVGSGATDLDRSTADAVALAPRRHSNRRRLAGRAAAWTLRREDRLSG